MNWLKQSTAATVKMGPFLDSTDGNTEKTALTIAQSDIRLTKNGGSFAQSHNAAGATHDEHGFYGVPLDTTDTDTVGRLRASIHVSGALAVWQDFFVVPANVYDSLVGTENLKVDVDTIKTQSVTCAAGVTVLASVGTAATSTAQTGDSFARIGATGSGLTSIAGIVWDEALAGHGTAGSAGAALTAAGSAGDPWATALPGAYGSGTAGKIVGDNLNATVSSRLASASYTAPDNATITAIDAKTTNLPADPAGVSDIPTADDNADALLDRSNGIETGRTPRQGLRLMLASLAGKLSGAATNTVVIRDTNDTKDRITATVDSDGNRTPITYDAS